MTQPSELEQQVINYFNTEQLPMSLASKLSTLLHNACTIDGDCDSAGPKWKEGAAAYELAARRFLSMGLPALADALIQEWWRELNIRQQRECQRFPIAIPTFLLYQIFFSVGDHGKAFRWILLSYAHDILTDHHEGLAPQLLRATFGLSNKDLMIFADIGAKCRNKVKRYKGDWGLQDGFPEEIVRRFAKDTGRALYADQISHLTTRGDFPVSPGYLQVLLQNLNKKARSTKEKGERLEQIAFYLMALLPGCVPKHAVIDIDKAQETDLVVRNLYQSSNIISDLFGRHILVECKNYKDSIGVSHVGYFLFRMRLAHAKFGVIFAPKGITGKDNEDKAARALVRRAFHEDGNICIVIDRGDLERLVAENRSFYWLLIDKYEEFRFGKPRENKE